MAFKMKSPLHVEGTGSTIDPNKKINLTKKDSPDFAKSGIGSKVISYQQYRDSGGVPKGMESVFSGKGQLRVSKSYTGKKSSGKGEGSGQGNIESTTKPTASTKTDTVKRKTDTVKRKTRTPREEVKAVELKTRKINTGDTKALNKKDVLDSTPEISTRKPTVKTAPKDNSRKAIRKRKTADKAAGVSKSQMRANKAKSKSEAALAKAKASKNPSFRAQLKRKSDRLAKRAERKGGSPAKIVDPNPKSKPKAKMRTDAEIKKAYPGAVKVKGKINTYKYKGATLNPARFPVEKKGKTPKEAIKLKDKK